MTDRYSRQLPLIGWGGQEKLKNGRVLCVGAGGLGCPALLSLAAAGVGKLGIIDGDRVALSNLHRQTLFTEKDVGRLKVECAKERLLQHRSDLDMEAHAIFLDDDNAASLLLGYDLILDGTDNYSSRYLINRVSRQLAIPLISGSIFQFDAQMAVFNLPQGPCYQCLYPASPPEALAPSCREAGVLGSLTALMGSLQAAEALIILSGLKGGLKNRLLRYNLLSMEFRLYPIRRRKGCPTCEGKTEPSPPLEIERKTFQKWVQENKEIILLDVREPSERQVFHMGGTLFPLPQMVRTTPHWPKGATLVCYCQRGGRSLEAAQWLRSLGYQNAYSIKGGMGIG